MRKNLKLLIVISCFSQAYFWLGTWIFYYLRFTDYAGIGIIETVFLTTGFVLEVPTGAIADLIGKKKTLALAQFVYAFGNFFLAGDQTFIHLIIGMFLLGVGGALSSGTFEALLFDSLKEDGGEKDYGKYLSTSQKYALITMSCASFLGGMMYKVNPVFPLIAVGISVTIAGVIALFLLEPHLDTYKFDLKEYLQQNLNGFRELSINVSWKKILPILLICSFTIVLTESIDLNLALSFGLNETQLGWFYAIAPIVTAIGAHYYTRIQKLFGENKLALFIWLLFVVSIAISPKIGSLLGVTFILVRNIFYDMPGTISSEIINHNISSKNRATTISTFTFIEKVPYIATAFFIGFATDSLGARHTSFLIGIFFLLIISTAYILNTQKNLITIAD